MGMRRHKIRVCWHKLLKDDVSCVQASDQYPVKFRKFRKSEVYCGDLMYYDYPERTLQRSWKKHRKHQYK